MITKNNKISYWGVYLLANSEVWASSSRCLTTLSCPLFFNKKSIHKRYLKRRPEGRYILAVLKNIFTLAGTPKDRGITLWRQETTCPTQRASRVSSSELYRVPFFSSLIDRFPFWGKLPFCPPASATTTSSPGSADHDAQVWGNSRWISKKNKSKLICKEWSVWSCSYSSFRCCSPINLFVFSEYIIYSTVCALI